jgi:hypothetical protein
LVAFKECTIGIGLEQPIFAMPTSKDFSLESLQASVFLPESVKFVSSKVVGVMLKHHARIFDGEMQVLPIPDGMPAQIPRVFLQSADGKRRFSAGPTRADFVFDDPGDIAEAARWFAELTSLYVRDMEVNAKRLAFIANRFCQNENPASALISAFCNERSQAGPFARSATFEIHNHKEYKPQSLDYIINSWVRCKCRKSENSSPEIIVTQDLNTLSKDELEFDEAAIHLFFESAYHEANEILARYFPG